jgi:CHAD domain-containing protein
MYGDGRAAYRAARKKPTVGNLHEWRKRVKDLWYSATILRSAWPAMMNELAAEAHVLSDLLGEDHDLAMLAQRATGKKHKQLRRAIAKRRARLQRRALKMGKRLYAEKPKGFARRIGVAWRASH